MTKHARTRQKRAQAKAKAGPQGHKPFNIDEYLTSSEPDPWADGYGDAGHDTSWLPCAPYNPRSDNPKYLNGYKSGWVQAGEQLPEGVSSDDIQLGFFPRPNEGYA